MADLVVCQFGLLTIAGKEAYRPIVALYSRDWTAIADEIKSDGVPMHDWCLAVVDAWDNLVGAQADTRIKFVPPKTLTGGFTGGERNAINTQLTAMGVVTRVVPSDTMTTLLKKLGTELNQTIDFDPSKLVR